MQIETRKISLRLQLFPCLLLCALAAGVILMFHGQPYVGPLLAGLPMTCQVILGLVIGAVGWAVSVIGYKYTARHQATRSTIDSYSRLDLRGWNPLWIALAAGFGEELLFRGALQPLLGIWITSVLFVLVHARAYRFNKLGNRVLVQALDIFASSVILGFLARYAGLVTAMIVHAAIDVVGLYAIRRATHVHSPTST